jgi:hypothetical protein
VKLPPRPSKRTDSTAVLMDDRRRRADRAVNEWLEAVDLVLLRSPC